VENNVANQEALPARQSWRALAVVIAVPVLLLLPFTDKAFEAGEPWLVLRGNQILKNPAYFFGFSAKMAFD